MYNPFSVDLADISAKHLIELKDVSEGWFVEYKSQCPDVKSLGKSISSFANSYGGYLFIGAQTAAGGNQLASIPGLTVAEIASAEQKVREAVTQVLNPQPYYEFVRVAGPLQELGLSAERCLLAVRIHEGVTPPYMHNSGRIYRRVGDSSDPKPETDRTVLDLLWQKTLRRKDRLESQLSSFLPKQSGSNQIPVLTVYVLPDDPVLLASQRPITYDEFLKAVQPETKPPFSISFNSIFSTQNTFVATCDTALNLDTETLFSWEYDRFEHLHVIRLAIPGYLWSGQKMSAEPRVDTLYWNAFQAELKRAALSNVLALDLMHLYFFLGYAFRLIRLIHAKNDADLRLRMNAHIQGVRRAIPFIDTKTYIEKIQENGFPMNPRDVGFLRPTRETEQWLSANPLTEDQIKIGVDVQAATCLMIAICEGLGIPVEVAANLDNDSSAKGLIEFTGAVNRYFQTGPVEVILSANPRS